MNETKVGEKKRELSDLEKADCLTGKNSRGIALRAPGSGDGKRRRFVFEGRASCYHVMSRVAGGDLLFGETEKEAFRKLMRRLEKFSGVQVLTYVVMGNHFHLLLRVPEKEVFLARFKKGSREEREARLMEHLKLLYSKAYREQLSAELEVMKKQKMADLYEKTMAGYLRRFCSLEHFVKELKERFSRWFNKRHGRRGTLWQERYKSILVEDGEALQAMAAYIDLNPLRAGLVEDPKDYRWCGYAEAVGGSKRAWAGICRVMEVSATKWGEVGQARYRRLLLTDGMVQQREIDERSADGEKIVRKVTIKRGFDRASALKELEAGGKISRGELVRCRVRYFSDGLVLGSRGFVEKAFKEKRGWFGEKRKEGARGLPVVGGLFSLRKLRVKAIE